MIQVRLQANCKDVDTFLQILMLDILFKQIYKLSLQPTARVILRVSIHIFKT